MKVWGQATEINIWVTVVEASTKNHRKATSECLKAGNEESRDYDLIY